MYRNWMHRKKHVPKGYVPKLSSTESDLPPPHFNWDTVYKGGFKFTISQIGLLLTEVNLGHFRTQFLFIPTLP